MCLISLWWGILCIQSVSHIYTLWVRKVPPVCTNMHRSAQSQLGALSQIRNVPYSDQGSKSGMFHIWIKDPNPELTWYRGLGPWPLAAARHTPFLKTKPPVRSPERVVSSKFGRFRPGTKATPSLAVANANRGQWRAGRAQVRTTRHVRSEADSPSFVPASCVVASVEVDVGLRLALLSSRCARGGSLVSS